MAETFAERLRRLREHRGMSVGNLALRAGLTEGAIRKMEYGDTKGQGFVNGLRIAEALGVDPWELAFGKKPKKGQRGDSKTTESRLRSLQEQVATLADLAKAGVDRLDLTESQKRQILARLEKLP
jgi:transcriptional regulator with XRE-family HTH domain